MQRARSAYLALVMVAAGVLSLAHGAQANPVQDQKVAVSVQDNAYSPEPFTISPGTTVTWTNRGQVPHTVTSDDAGSEAFDSNTLDPGMSFSHTFNHAGVYTYHCSFHDNMLGTIIVEDAPGGNSISTPLPSPSPTISRPAPTPVHITRTLKHVTVHSVTNGGVSRFSPAVTRIKVGTVVVWKNSTAVFHTVTSRTHAWAFKRNLGHGATVSFTFRKPGTYKYYCIVHPGMVGTVIVQR